jgi:hypothetical protein
VRYAEAEYARVAVAVRARLAALELRTGRPLLYQGVPYALRLDSVAALRAATEEEARAARARRSF